MDENKKVVEFQISTDNGKSWKKATSRLDHTFVSWGRNIARLARRTLLAFPIKYISRYNKN